VRSHDLVAVIAISAATQESKVKNIDWQAFSAFLTLALFKHSAISAIAQLLSIKINYN
jgi:hypothetical protein